MTASALYAKALRGVLDQSRSPRDLARRYYRASLPVVEACWMSAKSNDSSWFADAARPAAEAFMVAYMTRLMNALHVPAVARRVIPVISMVASPLNLFHPACLWAVLRSKVRPFSQPARVRTAR